MSLEGSGLSRRMLLMLRAVAADARDALAGWGDKSPPSRLMLMMLGLGLNMSLEGSGLSRRMLLMLRAVAADARDASLGLKLKACWFRAWGSRGSPPEVAHSRSSPSLPARGVLLFNPV